MLPCWWYYTMLCCIFENFSTTKAWSAPTFPTKKGFMIPRGWNLLPAVIPCLFLWRQMSHDPPGDDYQLYIDCCHLSDEVCWRSSNFKKKIQHFKWLHVIWRGKSAVFILMLAFHKLIEGRESSFSELRTSLNFLSVLNHLASGLPVYHVILLPTPTKCWKLWWHRVNF